MFEFMHVMTLRAVFEAKREGHLPPYLGSTIRGVLGHCFRDFVCHTPEVKCFCCEGRQRCAYVRNFSNTGGEGGAINPFVLYPHTYGKTDWKPGDLCTFDLTLFGHAADNPGIYLDALLCMAEKGWGVERIPFCLKRVTEAGTDRLIYVDGQTWLRNLTSGTMKIRTGDVKTVLIAFDTPVRIISGGDLCSALPFEVLMRFLAGRFSLLTQVHTDFTLEWNQEEMLINAAEVKTLKQEWKQIDFVRYSMNQKDHKLDLPAMTGWALYGGNLSPFVPYLEAGKIIHIGKNTTMGFGHYEVSYDGEVWNG